jgi:hypothetical protein
MSCGTSNYRPSVRVLAEYGEALGDGVKRAKRRSDQKGCKPMGKCCAPAVLSGVC